MISYSRSAPGRLLALSMALPLAVGAAFPFNAECAGYYALPLIVGISLAVIAVGLGIEDYPGETLTGVIALPVALFLYVLLVGVVAPQVRGVVYAMAVGACALLAVAMRPALPAARNAVSGLQKTA